MSYAKLTDLIEQYGHWCRQVGYCDAATRTPFPNWETMQALDEAKKQAKKLLEQINKLRSDDLTEQVRAAEQASANVFTAALAGIDIGRKEVKEGQDGKTKE